MRRTIVGVALALVVAAALLVAFLNPFGSNGSASGSLPKLPGGDRTFSNNGVVRRACALSPEILTRIWRGYYGDRSEDITVVPQFPDFPGGLDLPSHAGPWEYLQRVPLVLYGPRITHTGMVTRHASLTDVYPTVGKLLGVHLQPRTGSVLHEALRPGVSGVPRLVATVVWDGIGRNVLQRWPKAWPNLRRLQRHGTSYYNATVGSSPSITPATHTTLGTGAFPRQHGIIAINYRADDGSMTTAYKGIDPSGNLLSTFADQIDQALGNLPKVGMLAWKSWHLGMLSHGTEMPGGDADQLALLGTKDGAAKASQWYSLPPYLGKPNPHFDKYAQRLDRSDGRADGKWLGHGILGQHANPAWVWLQSEDVMKMLKRERYGLHTSPDLFFTNFKVGDVVGHDYIMDSPEMRDVIKAQDAALGRIVRYLKSKVHDFVLIVTADHGHVPSYRDTGGWAVGTGEMRRDIDVHFDAPSGQSLTIGSGSTGIFMNRPLMHKMGISYEDVARYLNDYRLGDNANGTVPPAFADRVDENVFSAAFPRRDMTKIMQCKFGSDRPPGGMKA